MSTTIKKQIAARLQRAIVHLDHAIAISASLPAEDRGVKGALEVRLDALDLMREDLGKWTPAELEKVRL